MLSIRTSSKPTRCNLLPCRIKHTGPTDATEKHWIVIEGEDGTTTASFRGRKLNGKAIAVPAGYQGHVLEVTAEESSYGDKVEKAGISIFKGLSNFDEIMIWVHDAAPDESTDGAIRAMKEWIGFANKINGFSMGDEVRWGGL